MQEIDDPSTEDDGQEARKWIMKAARGEGSRRALKLYISDAWSSLVDLVKVRPLLGTWVIKLSGL